MDAEIRFTTYAVQEVLPCWLINLLWFLQDSADVTNQSSAQVFYLSRVEDGQRIEYRQSASGNHKTLDVSCDDAVSATVYIVKTEAHSTMMLAEEYN